MENSDSIKSFKVFKTGGPPVARVSWRMLLLGIVASSSLLLLLLRHLDWKQFCIALAQIHCAVLAVPVVTTLGGFLLKPWRWQHIFPHRMKVGYWSCFGALGVGNMANYFLPARGGDLLRCFLVARRNPLTRASTALATLGLARIFDGVALVVVLSISSLFFTPPRWLLRLASVSALVFGGGLVFAFLLHSCRGWFLDLTHSVFRTVHLKPLGDEAAALFEWFAQGLGAVSSPPEMARLVILTALIWMADAVGVWGLAWALRISVSIPAAALVSAIVGLSMMIPAAPGFIGTYEFFSVAALRLLGVEFASAMALTVLMHAWSLTAAIMVGAGGLGVCGISFSGMVHGDISGINDERVLREGGPGRRW